MRIHRIMLTSTLVIACSLTALQADAHRVWFVPETTVVSGESPWIPFDAAVSNDLFYANHYPFPTEHIKVITPDGSSGKLHNVHSGKYRSTFDLNLTKPGTYKVESASHQLSARWVDADGKRQFWPPRGNPKTAPDFDRDVPKDAKDLSVSFQSRRLETWVTAGDTTDTVLKPTNKGLELVLSTHPNDLFSGEKTSFQLLMDGEPAAGAEITVIRGSSRYRNSQDEMSLTADKNGRFSIEWTQPGMYWMNASYEDSKAKAPATSRRGSYTATMEVLPE